MADPDRVNVTLGMKFPGAVDFASVHWSVSISSDVKHGETTEDVFARLRDEVEKRNEELYEEYGRLREKALEDEEDEEEDEEDED